jgi:actin-related protein 9
MFPAEKEGEWEPYKVRRRLDVAPKAEKPPASEEEAQELNEMKKTLGETEEDEVLYEEDHVTEEGAVWPIQEGRIVNWSCFFALITHVYNTLNPPFHTPILLIGQPAWTPREHEKLTQFFFEKFKTPAFALMDSALATAWAYGVHTATVVDVGKSKVDVTAVSEFVPHYIGRVVALPDCGGEALTLRLLEKLKPKGFNREMCEQLKKSSICEILPVGVPLPGSTQTNGKTATITNPAAAASTGATGSGSAAAAAIGNVPRGPGADTEVGDEPAADDENEGVLDVASIVAGGRMTEYLARKEKEKQEKAAAKKKGVDTAAVTAKPNRLPNSKREKATFMYEDHELLDTLKGMNLGSKGIADAQAALDEGPQQRSGDDVEQNTGADANGTAEIVTPTSRSGPIRREIEVGVERFQAASGGVLETIADAIHRTISALEDVSKRSELWDSLIICGNGSRVRGFKEALMSILHAKYLISPSSATIFTSELPSNITTPTGTGTNTPQPQLGPHGGTPSGVNPLLLAATTAQNPHLMPPGINQFIPGMSHNTHSSHGQTPSSIKHVKAPDYFPEWKDVGLDESPFLGAQIAAKVLFVVDQGMSKGYMTRPDYNDQGPTGIHDYSL